MPSALTISAGRRNRTCTLISPSVRMDFTESFTSALPAPQKGPQVLVGAATGGAQIPVLTGEDTYSVSGKESLSWGAVNGSLSNNSLRGLYSYKDSNGKEEKI